MQELYEVFPVLGGIFTGLVCITVRSPRARRLLWIALSILFGFAATLISGEYRESWWYLAFDMPLVAGSAWLTQVLWRLGRHRYSARSR